MSTVHIYAYVHTYMHACMHTYIHEGEEGRERERESGTHAAKVEGVLQCKLKHLAPQAPLQHLAYRHRDACGSEQPAEAVHEHLANRTGLRSGTLSTYLGCFAESEEGGG